MNDRCSTVAGTALLQSVSYIKIIEMFVELPLLFDSSQCAMSPFFLLVFLQIALWSLNPTNIIPKPIYWDKAVLTSKRKELNSFTGKWVPEVLNWKRLMLNKSN